MFWLLLPLSLAVAVAAAAVPAGGGLEAIVGAVDLAVVAVVVVVAASFGIAV